MIHIKYDTSSLFNIYCGMYTDDGSCVLHTVYYKYHLTLPLCFVSVVGRLLYCSAAVKKSQAFLVDYRNQTQELLKLV